MGSGIDRVWKLHGDGRTVQSGLFGGSGTTTYAESYARDCSTLAYLIAGVVAIALGLLPKLGARIWIEANVNFRDPVNLVTAAVLRFFEPEVPPHTGIGDSLVEPLAQAPDRRRPGTA